MTRLIAWRGWLLAGAVVTFAVLAWLTHGPLDLNGFGTFDAPNDFFYGVTGARDYLAALQQHPSAAATYRGLYRGLDTLFPVLITAWFTAMIWIATQGAVRWCLLAIPAVYFLLDMSENFGVAALIEAGPAAAAPDILAVRLLTQAKMVTFLAAALLALRGLRREARTGKGEDVP